MVGFCGATNHSVLAQHSVLPQPVLSKADVSLKAVARPFRPIGAAPLFQRAGAHAQRVWKLDATELQVGVGLQASSFYPGALRQPTSVLAVGPSLQLGVERPVLPFAQLGLWLQGARQWTVVDGSLEATGRSVRPLSLLSTGLFVSSFSPVSVAIERIDGTHVAAVGEAVAFQARVRIEGDAFSPRVEWTFGDGHAAVGARVVHRFREPGRYTVECTVRAGSSVDYAMHEVLVVPERRGSSSL
jgi:hypothetical protein